MFLNKINLLLLKLNVKKRLTDVKPNESAHSIKKVGIVLDDKLANFKGKIKDILLKNHISENNITFITFKNNIKKGEPEVFDVFSTKDVTVKATFDNGKLNWFLNAKYDLLINFYEDANPVLMLLTNATQADFKVGFASVDKRLNHLVINTKSNSASVFIDEMIKYLQILNKI